jgi:hypothetical protein
MALPVVDIVQRGWRSNPNIALGPNVISAKANRSHSLPLLGRVDLLPQGSSTHSTEMDGEQIPRISPGFMADVHAPFLHESAIFHFEEI